MFTVLCLQYIYKTFIIMCRCYYQVTAWIDSASIARLLTPYPYPCAIFG